MINDSFGAAVDWGPWLCSAVYSHAGVDGLPRLPGRVGRGRR